ncbi:diacylglycerol kinase [Pseudogemmobacter blasticus]|uniref:Diacylglycerol kinase n=1 Tax=Fuscovulum blasticum DSM 2131 TaxID=1188250 RepID=A0A2T4JCI6_FUSBL|nr:diacylglycerol kinase [Fuscovulum blasticum]PTE15625.1 diacylglycerol kinase [Fuscovulum blasticum DSM 2131]
MTGDGIPPRKTGLAHFAAAASYSAAGLKRLAQESAFRQEALAGLAILLAMAVLGASVGEMLGFFALLCLLIAVEALNTAIEVVVDHLAPKEWARFAKEAKDLGSLAVAMTITAIGAYLLWVILA